MAILDLVVAKPMENLICVESQRKTNDPSGHLGVVCHLRSFSPSTGHSWHLEDKGTPLSIWPLEKA